MLTACWSVKGGSGATVVAAGLALAYAVDGHVVAADLGGDLPAALGIDAPGGAGLVDWFGAGTDLPPGALGRVAHDVAPGLTLLGRGAGRLLDAPAGSGTRLVQALREVRPGAPVVVDCGVVESAGMCELVGAADRSLLVVRNCYLAVRRALAAPRPTAVVVVREPDRMLSTRDVAELLEVPVALELAVEPRIARAVDAGLLQRPLPRRVRAAVRRVAA